jgi:hypothetical protein
MTTMNTRGARAAGYRALTVTYHLPREQALLDNVLGDMRRGHIDHVLVKTKSGVAVWRGGRNGRAA